MAKHFSLPQPDIGETILLHGLPSDQNIEKEVLGCFLRYQKFRPLMARLSDRDFSTEIHRRIMMAVQQVYMEGGAPAHAAVYRALADRKQAESVGGLGYLMELDEWADGADLATERQFTRQISVLREKAALRDLIRCLYAAMNNCLQQGKPSDIAQVVVDQIRGIVNEYDEEQSKARTAEGVILAAGGLDAFLKQGSDSDCIATPWTALNGMVGGLRATKLWILAGRPSSGKSSAALQMACKAAKADKRVAFFSLEMPAADLIRNATAAVANVDSQLLHRGAHHQADINRIQKAAAQVASYPIEYFEFVDRDPGRIRMRLEASLSRDPVDLVVIDYLQLLTTARRTDNRNQELSEITRSLKLMAGEFRVPFLVLSQLTRDPAKEKRPPALQDLRDSGAIEQDADVVIFLHPTVTDGYNTKMIVAKNRLGPIGEFPAQFEFHHCRFKED